jgi:hypothetical protein
MAACPVPPYVDRCPPIRVYEVGGTAYIALLVCDKGNSQQVVSVYQFCDGVPAGAPTLFDLNGAAYTPVGIIGRCDEADFEQNIFCDTSINPPKPFISRVVFTDDMDIVVDLTGTFELDGVTPYVPVGPITVCGGDTVDIEFIGPLCEKDSLGNLVGQVWYKTMHRGTVALSATLSGYKTAAPSTWIDPYSIAVGNTLTVCDSKTPQIVKLCDVVTTPSWSVTTFLRHYCVDCLTGTYRDTTLDGTTVYTVVGTVTDCESKKPCMTCR